MQTFGSGRSQIDLTSAKEFEILSHTLSPAASTGTITFFWITAWNLNDTTIQSAVDFALWRFYIDNETTASIGPMQTAQAALIGNASPSASWSNDFFGKNADWGGWHFNLQIPFGKSVRVTVQLPPDYPKVQAWAIVRGVENLPVTIGSLTLPPTARLTASVRKSTRLPVLGFHELVNIRSGPGLLLATMIDISSTDKGSLNSLEGCWHAYMPPNAPYPGLLLGTGAEDYPESAFYFNAGLFKGPTSGLSVMSVGNATQPVSRISFFKLHHREPMIFTNGFRFNIRNGDVTDPKTGEKCANPNGDIIGKPGVSDISTLVYVYTW